MSDSETDKNPFGEEEEEESTDEKKEHNSPTLPEKLQEAETKEKEEEQPPHDQAAKSTPTTPSFSDANATTASFTSVDLTDDDNGKAAAKTGRSEGEPSNRGRTIPASISNMAASQEQLTRAATAIYKTPQRLASSLSDLGEKGIINSCFVSQQQCESKCSLDALFS